MSESLKGYVGLETTSVAAPETSLVQPYLWESMPNFEIVQHRLFGPGFAFSQRELGVGSVLDVWFIRDEKVRTVLSEPKYWIEPHSGPLEFSKRKRKSAYAQYKKLHTRPTSETEPSETIQHRRIEEPDFAEEAARLSLRLTQLIYSTHLSGKRTRARG